MSVECIYCHKVGTHRVCQECFDKPSEPGRVPCDRYEVTNGAGICVRCGFPDDQHQSGRVRGATPVYADEDERTCPAREGENRCGTPRPCPVHMPYQYGAWVAAREQS